MQQLPTDPPVQIHFDCITDVRARELREHPAAKDTGFGWLKIAHQEHFPDRTLLVSTTSPVSVTFRHDGKDFDQRLASLLANIHARNYPQPSSEVEFDVDETDAASTATAS